VDPPDSVVSDAVSELRARVQRYPPERYPVQNATASFHLGVALLEAGRAADAIAPLRSSAELFEPRLPVEHAKALNMLGAALRSTGAFADAAERFSHAANLFAAAERPVEAAAARYNLGLARREAGDLRGAVESLDTALELFDGARLPAQAAAAARELGAALLTAGDVDAAQAVLERATDRARAAEDSAGLAAAANVLGLARLAAARADAAVEAFTEAVAANPRGLRAEGHAMAKANLALAYERTGAVAAARLAARQAAGVPGAPPVVLEQAAGVIERLGTGADDLYVVLDSEPADRWPGAIRAEVLRALDAPESERRRTAAAWIDGQLARPAVAGDIAEAWLGVLLELPPPDMEAMLRATLLALAGEELERVVRFRSMTSRAMARFYLPQWSRLAATFNRLAADVGSEQVWG